MIFDVYYDIVDISKREIDYIHHFMPQDALFIFPVDIKINKIHSMDMYDFEEKIFDVLDKFIIDKIC